MRSARGRLPAILSNPRFRLVALLAGLTLLFAVLRSEQLLPPVPPEPPDQVSVPPPLPRSIYKSPTAPILVDSLDRGETLSQLWERNGRSAEEMAGIVSAAGRVFEVRLLRAGAAVEMFVDREAQSRPASGGVGPLFREPAPAPLDSVRIKIDADRTLAVHAELDGSYRGELREVPVREVYRTHVGCIETSLVQALENEREDFSLLALDLDRIFGGVIDFYSDLQPGDCVALHFQAFVRPDGSYRLGLVQAAELVNRGNRHLAIHFQLPDGTEDYYDLDGKSLKRQFLRSPLKFTRISSGFTLRRFHPVLKRYRAHPGVDYAAPSGTPVQAAGNGSIAFAGWKRGYGKVVEIRHGKTYETHYAHLSRIPRGVRRGARVSQGEIIGYVGSTGLSTGPHLDYRFLKNGRFVNPLAESEKLPIGEPVPSQYVTLFADRRDRAVRLLDEAYQTALVGDGRGSVLASGAASVAALGRGAGSTAGPTFPQGATFGDD